MVVAWFITTAFYVLMNLATKGRVPKGLDVFLAVIILVSLAMHLAIRR